MSPQAETRRVFERHSANGRCSCGSLHTASEVETMRLDAVIDLLERAAAKARQSAAGRHILALLGLR